jgi:P-type Cu+ transporter
MKKFGFISIALLAMCGATFAQAKKTAKKDLHCAVMSKDKVDVAKAEKSGMFVDYKGNRYYFCCPSCKPAFKANPEKFAKNDHVKIPAKKKA